MSPVWLRLTSIELYFSSSGKLELEIKVLLNLKEGKEQAQLVRTAVYSFVQLYRGTTILNQSPCVRAGPVNPLDLRQIWVVFLAYQSSRTKMRDCHDVAVLIKQYR